MKFKYFMPFLLFIIPIPIITYFMWASNVWKPYPKDEIIGIVGLCVIWFFVGLTYFNGLRTVLKGHSAE